MKKIVLIDQLRALGLEVDEIGLVSDGIFEFLRVHRTKVEVHDGRSFELKYIVQISYIEAEHLLTLETSEGEEKVYGGKFPVAIEVLEMPKTTGELDREFDKLFPDSQDMLYYDELREKRMIDMALLDQPEMGLVTVSDEIVALYHLVLEKRLIEMGYVGKAIPSRTVADEVLTIRIFQNRKNAFREWVESHEWDQKPRLRMCFRNYVGATAPALQTISGESTADELQYIGDVTEAWFMGAIARMYRPVQHDIVPVLIGGQGLGKGSFLKFISGNDAWFKSTSADVSKPEKFLESIRGAVVVELSESKQIRTSDNETLKTFISQSSDQMRRAYARYEDDYPRRFVMIATSNLSSVFTDLTGSRRFFPLECNPKYASAPIPIEERGEAYQYEVEQIWAEALYLYRAGHKWNLSAKAKDLAQRMQEFNSEENPGLIAIEEWLDDPVNGYTEKGCKITREEIMTKVFAVDATAPPKEMETMYRAWRNGTRRWAKCKPFFRDGKTRRGFERMFAPRESIESKTFNLVSGANVGPVNKDPIKKIREFVRENSLGLDDKIPVENVSLEDLTDFMMEGFIVDYGTSTRPDYRLVYLP